MLIKEGKRGQLAIFVIIAIVIVLGIVIFFVFRGKLGVSSVPAELLPVYNYYSSCIEKESRDAIDIAGSQGGKIYLEDYDPGSDYAPFSSQLNFLGFNIPYWYYISGNGVIRENVPSKTDIENDISIYVQEGLQNCNFEQFYAEGFSIEIGIPRVKTTLSESKVNIDVNSDIFVTKGEISAKKSDYNLELNSKLGKFFRIAREIYSKEKNEAFLENYSADVLRLYAPVDGVEISCSPKIWKTNEVVNDLKTGLEGNIAAIKFKGDYYSLNDKNSKYFVVNKDVDESVNLIYSSKWPTKINIVGEGVDDSLMIANVVGNQAGIGTMGFCYAPYHFVYDISFPVMIQIYNNEELFQFPVAVIIDKNLPRRGIFSEINQTENFDVCAFKTQDISVNVFDANLNNVEADISYGCFDQKCFLGKTTDGTFSGSAPACVNGYIYAIAENYSEPKQLFSSNNEFSTDIFLDKEYPVKLSVEVGGNELRGNAIVIFSGKKVVSASLPDAGDVKLSEGLYNVTVYVYGNSSVTIPESTKTQCTEVPKSGIIGFFGGAKETCFDITIPESKIDYALIGGGKADAYLLESNLQKGELLLKVSEFDKPDSLEQLQYNFESFEQGGIEIE